MYIPSFGRGGIERFVLNAAEELVSRDIQTDLLLRTTSPMLESLPEEVRIIRMQSGDRIEPVVGALVTSHVTNAAVSLWDYVQYLRHESPTLLLSLQTNPFALLGARLAQTDATVVIRESNTPSVAVEDPQHLAGKLAPLAKRFTYTRADHIVSVSADAGSDIAQMLDIDPERVVTIYNPTYTDRLTNLAEESISHSWFKDDRPIILSAGRFSDQKDFETLIRAFAQVVDNQDARLVLLGDGANRTELESLVTQLGIEEQVDFLGFKNNPYKYMRQADLFVLSSHYEGLPNVLIEALGVGTPVVATDCPSGPREILLDGRGGELVPVGDVSEMANAITSTLTNPDTAANKLETARAHLNRFTPEKAVDEYLSLAGHTDAG